MAGVFHRDNLNLYIYLNTFTKTSETQAKCVVV